MSKIVELFPAPPAGVLMVDDQRQLYSVSAQVRPNTYGGNCLTLTLEGEPLARPIKMHLSTEMARELQRELQTVINQAEGKA